LVTADYDDIKTWEYLDRVGLIHTGVQQQLNTGKKSTKSPLRVEFIHMGLLLGYVEDIIIDAVLDHPDLDLKTKHAVLKALNKVVWMQNDLFAKHYVKDVDAIEAERKQGFSKSILAQFPVPIAISLILTGLAYKFFA
ncbi:hypothetical protein EW146_g1034, partial [Bondarzewia mesenterica]